MTQVKNPDRIPYPRFQVRRRITRFFTRGLMRLLTRITVEGIDNIPSEGPVILAGNHAAYIEPVLMTMMPKRIVEPIGAGDIPFDGILDSLVGFYGFIPVNRGNLDRTALNRAISVLQQGGVIGIFPEGGTWEPGRMVPQPGAAMLSLRTGATVVPIGFSGLNGALKSALQLKRPKLLMRVGEPIPALKANGSIPDKGCRMSPTNQTTVLILLIRNCLSVCSSFHAPCCNYRELPARCKLRGSRSDTSEQGSLRRFHSALSLETVGGILRMAAIICL